MIDFAALEILANSFHGSSMTAAKLCGIIRDLDEAGYRIVPKVVMGQLVPSGPVQVAEPPKLAPDPKPSRERRVRETPAKAAEPPQAQTEPQPDPTPPATATEATQARFHVWLVDAEGNDLQGEDHNGGFTDPVAFAHAVAEVHRTTFPADWPAIARANKGAMDHASRVSLEADSIFLSLGGPLYPEGKSAHDNEPPPGMFDDEPAAERDPLAVNPLQAENKAGWERYVDQCRTMLASCHSSAMVDQFVAANEPAYRDFPPKYRIGSDSSKGILVLVKDRRDELKPPPPKPADAPLTPTGEAQAAYDQLVADISACQTATMLETYSRSIKVTNALNLLAERAPDLCNDVKRIATAKKASFGRGA